MQKVEAVKFFLRRTPACRPPRVHPCSPFGVILPRRHVLAACYVRTCFIFIHRRVLISPPPPRRARSTYEHRMGDKWSLRGWGGGGRRKKSGEMTSNNNGGVEERENIKCFVPSAATRRRGEGAGWTGEGGKGPPGD